MSAGDGTEFPWPVYAGVLAVGAAIGIGTARLTGSKVGTKTAVALGVAGVGAWELGFWLRRRQRRLAMFNAALADARASNRPLMVIGAPDRGPTSGYPCGDITVDLGPSSCPNSVQVDLTKPNALASFADDSVTVYVSCVLEYVNDVNAVLAELRRVAGSHLFICGVEPYTLTGQLFPGAKRTLPAGLR